MFNGWRNTLCRKRQLSQRNGTVAIRDAFVVTMPLMILGALAVLINNIPIPGYEDFLNKIFPMMYNDAPIWKSFGGNIWNGTFAIFAVLVAF